MTVTPIRRLMLLVGLAAILGFAGGAAAWALIKLINLITNAADAMEHSPVRVLSIGTAEAEGQVEITVTDTGAGVAAGDLPNLFDPFYSTKEAGRGLGLGLSISYGLVRDLGGSISVASRPGHGAAFTVRLPLVATARSESLTV